MYKDLAETLGVEMAVSFHSHFKGLQITFPIRLLSKEFVLRQLEEEFTGDNLKVLARKYGYSERWIRKLIYEMNEEEIENE